MKDTTDQSNPSARAITIAIMGLVVLLLMIFGMTRCNRATEHQLQPGAPTSPPTAPHNNAQQPTAPVP